MVQRIPITVRLESFEGPLDLLLHLIQAHELDISTISITEVTNQYLSYVRLMQELNFDVASEFLVMAATLLLWKSKALLPQEESETPADGLEGDDILTQEELVRRLLERQRFLAAGKELSELPLLGEDFFTRKGSRPPTEKIMQEMEITSLVLSFQQILIRSRKRKTVLKKETVSLSEKLLEFGERLQIGQLIELRKFLSEDPSRAEIVVTFLASLELSRLKKMKLHQEEVYRPIYVELIEKIQSSDLQLATGFESPQPATPDSAPTDAAVGTASDTIGAPRSDGEDGSDTEKNPGGDHREIPPGI